MATRRYLSWCQKRGRRVLLLRQIPYSTATETPPFQRAKRGVFFQEPPILYNSFVEDSALRSFLKRTLPEQVKFKQLSVQSRVHNDLLVYMYCMVQHKWFIPMDIRLEMIIGSVVIICAAFV